MDPKQQLREERAALLQRLADIDAACGDDAPPPAHELEELRRSSEARFHTMVDRGWDVLTITDEAGYYTYVSGSVTRVLGYTPAEMRGMRFADLLHPDDRERGLAVRAAARSAAGAGATFAMRTRHRDGSYVWIEISGVNLLHDPQIRGILATSRDITERVRAEEERARLHADLEQRVADRTAELDRAARAKDEFLASMSHELRTPLNAVLGLSELLQEGIHGPLNDKQRATLGRLDESARHLLALISDVLDVAKVEAGKLGLELGPARLGDVCRASLRLVQESAQRKRLTLDYRIGEDARVLLDERRMKQVLVNLLSNAVKFTPERGAIGLDCAIDEQAGVARFSVWDTGVGIAPEDAGRLFQPFVQLDSRLSRQHTGTGLGLALVRRLVDLHGGRVELASEPGHGARFTVELPLRRAEEPEQAPLAAPRESGVPARPGEPDRPRRVLLGEDDETNAATTLAYLESRGFEVYVARDGRQVVALARALRPDAVLMDIQMPLLDGLGATRELRADPSPEVAFVPIIAVTALAMPGDRERCLRAGADAYVTKPVGLRQLAVALEALIHARELAVDAHELGAPAPP
jgi:PAS domain S-box-containing protein